MVVDSLFDSMCRFNDNVCGVGIPAGTNGTGMTQQAEDDGDIRMADANGGRNGATATDDSATGTAAAASSACGAASVFSFSSIFCGGGSGSGISSSGGGGSPRQVDEAVPKRAESDVSSSVSISDQNKQRGEGGGLGMMQCIDIGNAQDALSHARREARNVYATARGGNSSSPVPRQASARGKRKADIFRSRHSPILEQAAAVAEAVEIEAKGSSRVASPVPMGGFCSPDLHGIHEDGIDNIMSRVGGGGASGFPSILCFANPVRDSNSEDEGDAAPNGDVVEGDVEVDGTVPEEARSTTSTQYFDNKKFNDIVESRPPMPLYHHQAIDPLLASDADQVTADDAPTHKAAADHDNHKAANIHGRGCLPVESSSSSSCSACDGSVASAPKHDECAPGGVRTQEQHHSPTALSTHSVGPNPPAAPITPGTDGEDYGEASNKRQRKLGPSVPALLGSAPVTPDKAIGVEV